MAVDLLQRVGLNKYEAEAYFALLVHGPLTGYELGKRSGVPLSRSYEILERLTRQGLALVQPGDPPRYAAEDPDRFLAHFRAEQDAVLAALAAQLAEARTPAADDELWVVRRRANVLARARAMIEAARQEVQVVAPEADRPAADDRALDDALADAAGRGCRVVRRPVGPEAAGRQPLVLLVDGREALVGTLSPAHASQAVVGTSPALVLAVRGADVAPTTAPTPERAAADEQRQRLDWIAWEDRKQQRLWRSLHGGRVA